MYGQPACTGLANVYPAELSHCVSLRRAGESMPSQSPSLWRVSRMSYSMGCRVVAWNATHSAPFGQLSSSTEHIISIQYLSMPVVAVSAGTRESEKEPLQLRFLKKLLLRLLDGIPIMGIPLRCTRHFPTDIREQALLLLSIQ